MARRFTPPLVRRVKDPEVDSMFRNVDQRIRELVEGQKTASDLDAQAPYSKAQVVALITLKSATIVEVDGSLSNNYEVLLTGNVTFANPYNVLPGQIINIAITQDATGSRTGAWGSAWKFPGGTPTLSTGAADVDLISGMVQTTTNGVATQILCSIAKDHT